MAVGAPWFARPDRIGKGKGAVGPNETRRAAAATRVCRLAAALRSLSGVHAGRGLLERRRRSLRRARGNPGPVRSLACDPKRAPRLCMAAAASVFGVDCRFRPLLLRQRCAPG